MYMFYYDTAASLQADDGDVVELDITQLDFGGRSCDEERIEIYKGLAGRKLSFDFPRYSESIHKKGTSPLQHHFC